VTAPIRDAAHLRAVRLLACCYCSARPVDAHHVGRHAMGSKTDDLRTIPLCRPCHDGFHRRATIGIMDAQQTREWAAEQVIRVLIATRRQPAKSRP